MSDFRWRIADEIASIQIGSGYESTTIGITAALEAADALIAAGVVTEEPEWEYGVRATGDNEPYTDHYDSLDAMSEEFDGRVFWNVDEEIVRRRKAGPWVPVKPEGAETDA